MCYPCWLRCHANLKTPKYNSSMNTAFLGWYSVISKQSFHSWSLANCDSLLESCLSAWMQWLKSLKCLFKGIRPRRTCLSKCGLVNVAICLQKQDWRSCTEDRYRLEKTSGHREAYRLLRVHIQWKLFVADGLEAELHDSLSSCPIVWPISNPIE